MEPPEVGTLPILLSRFDIERHTNAYGNIIVDIICQNMRTHTRLYNNMPLCASVSLNMPLWANIY